jgi:hypothetical protein
MQRSVTVAAAALFCLAVVTLGGCASMPEDAFQLAPTSLQERRIQSRNYATSDDAMLLRAGAGVLQDLGYAIDESNVALGVLSASKRIDAKDVGQIATALIVSALTGSPTPIDTEQTVRVCLVMNRSLADPATSVARITIQREIVNDRGQVARAEPIDEPEIYQAFFAKLSKATFLEANEI